MVTLAASRDRVVARRTSDRVMLRAFLEQDRLYAAYAICDLDEKEFRKTRWGVAMEGGTPVAVALEYGGLTPQPLFVMGRNDGISAILRDVIRPRAAFVACLSSSVEAVAEHYTVDPGPTMIRMWVDRASFRPYPADIRRLVPADISDLNRLYGLGFAAWLPSASIAEGVYYGIRVHGRLVAAAGTHVISREAGMGVVGNVLTHPDHRGRGYAKATTSAVTAELLRTCEHVALNVRADNPPAIQAYARLGFQPHVRFEERLAHRLGSPLAGLAAPLRRLFLMPREPER
jgi:GNAT superfamily N-acetyltransferase